MQKHVNLVDLVKSFPTNIYLQNLASIQKRTSPVKFAHLAEKSGKRSISNLSTKVSTAQCIPPRGRVHQRHSFHALRSLEPALNLISFTTSKYRKICCALLRKIILPLESRVSRSFVTIISAVAVDTSADRACLQDECLGLSIGIWFL